MLLGVHYKYPNNLNANRQATGVSLSVELNNKIARLHRRCLSHAICSTLQSQRHITIARFVVESVDHRQVRLSKNTIMVF